MRKIFSCKWMYIGMIFLYLTISDIFGLFDLNAWIGSGGEGYDLIFVLVLLGSIYVTQPYIHIPKFKEARQMNIATCVLFGYIVISGVMLVVSGGQSFFQTLSVMREVFYILIFYSFWQGKYETDEMLKLMIGLELIAGLVYFVECFTGPLTTLHIGGSHGGISGIWRFYSASPLFVNFICPLLVYRHYKKEYFFSAKKDILLLFLFLGFQVIKQGRTALIATLLIVLFSIIDASGRNKKKIINGLILIPMVAVISAFIGSTFFPAYWKRFEETFVAILNIGNRSYGSTLAVRTGTLQVRYEHLVNCGKLLFGLGPIHNGASLSVSLGASVYDRANAGVIATDTAYGSILTRYGVVGLFIYVLPYVMCIINYIRKLDPFCKSIALYAIGSLIGGMSAHAALCFFAPLKFGILLGIVFKERSEALKDSICDNNLREEINV